VTLANFKEEGMDGQSEEQTPQGIALLYSSFALYYVVGVAAVELEVATSPIVCAKMPIQDVPSHWSVVLVILGEGCILLTACVKDVDEMLSSEAIEGIGAVKIGCDHRIGVLVVR
jgi:hypothetical protein